MKSAVCEDEVEGVTAFGLVVAWLSGAVLGAALGAAILCGLAVGVIRWGI